MTDLNKEKNPDKRTVYRGSCVYWWRLLEFFNVIIY